MGAPAGRAGTSSGPSCGGGDGDDAAGLGSREECRCHWEGDSLAAGGGTAWEVPLEGNVGHLKTEEAKVCL